MSREEVYDKCVDKIYPTLEDYKEGYTSDSERINKIWDMAYKAGRQLSIDEVLDIVKQKDGYCKNYNHSGEVEVNSVREMFLALLGEI